MPLPAPISNGDYYIDVIGYASNAVVRGFISTKKGKDAEPLHEALDNLEFTYGTHVVKLKRQTKTVQSHRWELDDALFRTHLLPRAGQSLYVIWYDALTRNGEGMTKESFTEITPIDGEGIVAET